MNTRPDFLITGSGFAGSITAMILRRLGFSVVMVEKGRHPRFAIGESSTPLANLLLEELAVEFDLPELLPFCKWGTWQARHPEVTCGLKRGFTFFHHTAGSPMDPLDRGNQLLVGASPTDSIADTHWYRADFDHFLARAAVARGAELVEEGSVSLNMQGRAGLPPSPFQADMLPIENGRRSTAALPGEDSDGWTVEVQSPEGKTELKPRFILDASGPRGFLHRALGVTEKDFSCMPQTETLFSHFTGVRRMDELFPALAPGAQGLPYPVDDAAVHHVFKGGWIWVLRFNNGLTSAGVMAERALGEELRLSEGAAGWERLMERFPSVKSQFEGASPVLPFRHQHRVAFRCNYAAGPRWAVLPSSFAFVDPLLSNGFPLTLLGVQRLARAFAKTGSPSLQAADYETYNERTLCEAEHTAELIGALYRAMNDFPRFADLTRLYFAAASFSETVRRLGKPEMAPGFLLREHPAFAGMLRRHCTSADGSIVADIEPFNVAGLTDRSRRNWHPALAEDLLNAAPKVGSDRPAILEMLGRCGFKPSAA